MNQSVRSLDKNFSRQNMLVYLLFVPSILGQINCENFFDNVTYQVPSIPLDCPENICYLSTVRVPHHGQWLIGGCDEQSLCQGKEGTHSIAKVWRGDFEKQYNHQLPSGVDATAPYNLEGDEHQMRRILTLVLATGVVLSDYCPPQIGQRIQDCVTPVADYARVLNGKESDLASPFSLPNMGGRVFNELCKLIAKFNSCVGDYRQKCARHMTISLIDSSYGFLCNEGYNTFMESAECLMELDRRTEIKTCHDVTLHEIEDANGAGGIAMTAKAERLCGALNYFSGCVRSPIRRECGSSAWQVIYRVLKDTTVTLMPGCQFTGTSPRLTTVETPIVTEVVETTALVEVTDAPMEPATRKSMRKNISPLIQSSSVSIVRTVCLVVLFFSNM